MKSATFSPCRTYRYSLTRRLSMFGDRFLVFIGLNPSTADENKDDPTIRRCMGFAKKMDYDGIVMLNLFAFRATLPADMMKADDPIGPDNDRVLLSSDGIGCTIIGAWGHLGNYRNRAQNVINFIRQPIYCFGLTENGNPRHPLYIKYDTPLIELRKNDRLDSETE